MSFDPEVPARAYEFWQAAGSNGDPSTYWLQATVAHEKLTKAQPSRHLILVRHASRARTLQPEEKQRMDGWPAGEAPSRSLPTDDGKALRKSGWKKTLDIAISLADRLTEENFRVTNIFHSSHEAARQTAMVYASVLCRNKPVLVEQRRELDPKGLSGQDRKSVLKKLDEFWKDVPKDWKGNEKGKDVPDDREGNEKGRAVILVGHQPELTEIADIVLRSGWYGSLQRPVPLPLGGSEAACIRYVRPPWLPLGLRPRLRWLLTEKGESFAAELKDKVKSKVETAKFFLGALAVNAGLLVNTSVWEKGSRGQWIVLAAGGSLIFLALLFAVATLSGYDALNMPPAFWSEGKRRGLWPERLRRKASLQKARYDVDPPRRTVLRPPSEATVLLFYEMVKIWGRFFIPALVCSVAGVSLFLLALLMAKNDALMATDTRLDSSPAATVRAVSRSTIPPAPRSPTSTTALPSQVTAALPPPAMPASPTLPSADVVRVVLQNPPAPKMNRMDWATAAGLLMSAAGIVWLYYRMCGPKLGTED